ncbi:hypothetical protein IKE97_01715 [Candidatus Saccharibacteria bacterium]|nr:hypothetical protein [Candidatus Saccharibacteria bacterium]
MEKEISVSSVSFDEKTGTARVIIDGAIPASGKYDDPIVELFRPIREKHINEIRFVILADHDNDRVICTIIPSNCRGRDEKTLLFVAKTALQGDFGILNEYRQILENFFVDPDGLDLYLAKLEEAGKVDTTRKSELRNECNDCIKAFAEKNGLKMPSMHKTKKTKAQKKAESEAYLASHPEVIKK